LAYAHSNGIVHRDIKPPNILVTNGGGVKVMDFGIAHVVGSELTQADDVLGSPNYMAPEQLSKGRIDARTDLFAFGVVLYRMLTGKLPFTGESFAAIARGILFEEPPPPASLNPAIPEHLSNVVLRCLAKEPSLRYETASELKQALSSPAVDHEVRDTDEVVHSRASVTRGPTGSQKRPQPPMKAGGSSPGPSRSALGNPRLLLGAAGGLGVALLVSFALLREPSGTESDSHDLSTTMQEPALGSGAPSKVAEVLGAAERPAEASQQERSDAELYHQASAAFERGELDASKEALERLLRENPAFEGAPELLVRVNQELGDDEPIAAPERASAPAAAPVPAPAEAQLLYQATVAFERGDLEASKRQIETLLQTNPSLQGASELLVKVNDEIWKKGLPMSFEAKHNHRIGSCTGTLTLAARGIRYSSKDHEWQWDFDEIRLLERDGRWILNLETHETEALSLGKPKNHKFEFRSPIRDEDWSRYRRLVR
jgi:tetratricopeptide (TPR) repeat protein